MNVDVVLLPTEFAVPVIAAVDVLNDNPLGNEPEEIEYVILPVVSVAVGLLIEYALLYK